MAVVFSEEQSNVINLRDRNILVSAAAGSGKTTVLVERIIKMITDEKNPIDIDHLLVVTFTNAAAASMREKISNAIAKKLENEYSDHLQKQATLIHHAQITTIDSFCLFVLQNNFNDIGLEPGFRVADQGEIRLLKEDVMDRLLEKRLLEDGDGKFEHLLDRFVSGSKIGGFRDVLFSLYERALSYPFVKDWLMERKADYAIGEDFDSAAWVQEIFAYATRDLAYCKELTLQNVEDCKAAGGPSTYLPMMEADLALVTDLLACDSYTKLHEKMQILTFETLSRKKDENADPDFKELVKKHRDEFKKTLQGLQKDFFAFSVEDMREAAKENAVIVGELCDTLLAFHEDFLEVKKDKKLIDFSDMEHFALEILLKKEGDVYVPTKTALEYREYFHEIMIDEYQDSNLVQEWLLQCISKEDNGVYNRFMVGDVKQSIYQFRLARPQIFMEKFDTYEKEVHDGVKLQRIDLAKNYRSRKEVVECVNYLFYRIMGRDLGNVSYDKDSALYLGAAFANKEQGIPDTAELCLLEKEEDSNNAKEQEARMIALKIKELLANYYVTDEHTGEFRKASYRDIVILLRKTKEWDEVFKNVFESEGIPAYITKSSGYFETGEIRVLLNFLKCLDNPKQDVALFGTMTSALAGFTDEEMALICSVKEGTLWTKVQAWEKSVENGGAIAVDNATAHEMPEEKKSELSLKCKKFIDWYTGYRKQIPYEPIHKILRSVIQEKGYLYEVASMPGGQQRLANVQMLLAKAESFEKSSYSGLFHFIRYIDKVQKYDIEFGEAGIMDEQDDVVRIMTIHKSKGLEFPICFVAGCAGRFNQMDAQKAIICDSNYGIGLDYVDIANRVKYKDIRKRFLAKHIVEENLGEELRVLYVALTRAKEKLILTGICPSFENLAKGIDGRKQDDVLCHFRSRMGAKSYLDWIVEALAHHPVFVRELEPYGYHTEKIERDVADMEVSLYTPQMIEEIGMEMAVSHEWDKETLLRIIGEPEREADDDELLQQIHFTYQHENLKNLYTKTSVSELKMAAMHKAFEKESVEEAAKPMFDTEVINPYIPKFASEEKEASGSDRGSAYHRVLELLDYVSFADLLNDTPSKEGDRLQGGKVASKEENTFQGENSGAQVWCKEKLATWYDTQLQRFIDTGRITQQEADLVNPKKVITFLQSPVAKRMAQAAVRGDLYKEQPFVLGIRAERLSNEFPKEETVLIQGIIDVYFVEDNEIVLLDYKTDAVSTGAELVQRYKTQLDYYKEALENINGRKVKERLLYAFRLDEVVEVE